MPGTFNFWPDRGLEHSTRPMIPGLLSQIPYSLSMELFRRNSEFYFSNGGFFPVKSEIITERRFFDIYRANVCGAGGRFWGQVLPDLVATQ